MEMVKTAVGRVAHSLGCDSMYGVALFAFVLCGYAIAATAVWLSTHYCQ